jgi:hypothetical protein
VRNFGAIFDASINMIKTTLFLVILMTFIPSANGQDKSITEFDLYGCWIMERNADGQKPKKRIYKRCEDSDSKLTIKSSKISLLASNESEEQRYHPFACPLTYTEKGTWEFDASNGLITMYGNKEFLKELKEKHPEQYAKFGSPEKIVSNRFRIVELSENQMEVEKLRTTKPIANRAKSE